MEAGPPVARSRTHAALASVSRARLPDTLRRSEHPLDAVELAAALAEHWADTPDQPHLCSAHIAPTEQG